MEDHYDLREELLRDGRRVVRGAQHGASVEIGLRDSSQAEPDVVSRHSPLHRSVMGLDGLDFSGEAFGHDRDGLTDLHFSGLDPPYGDRAATGDPASVLDLDS